VLSGISGALSAVGKINIPSTGLASPDPEKSCTGMEPLTMDSVSFPLFCKFPPVAIQSHGASKSFELSFVWCYIARQICISKCITICSRLEPPKSFLC
jgi:hypothetical protein